VQIDPEKLGAKLVQQDFDFAAKRTPLVQLELVTSLSGLFDEKYLAKTLVKSKGQYLDS